MHYIITYATGMDSQLYKINSEIHILNFGYLSSGQFVFTCASVLGSVTIFRIQKGSASRTLYVCCALAGLVF
jgi:hypothetical protein